MKERTGRKTCISVMMDINLNKEGCIAVMDSGLGGISVLRELLRLMPKERFLYYGDSRNAPYGEKPPEEIVSLCFQNTRMLLGQGAKCLVIACNTATSVAAEALRQAYPELPVIGMEPAVKPAASGGGHPRILVLATPITIKGDRLHHLVETHGAGAEFILREAPGIVRLVEVGICDANPKEALFSYLEPLLSEFSRKEDGRVEQKIDGVVLGCTHFPFVKRSIQKVIGYPVQLYDGAQGTARETRRRLLQAGLLLEAEQKWEAEQKEAVSAADPREAGQMPAEAKDGAFLEEAAQPVQRVQLQNSDPAKLSAERMLLTLPGI